MNMQRGMWSAGAGNNLTKWTKASARAEHTVQKQKWLPSAEPLMMICRDAKGASRPLNAWNGQSDGRGASSLKAMPGL